MDIIFRLQCSAIKCLEVLIDCDRLWVGWLDVLLCLHCKMEYLRNLLNELKQPHNCFMDLRNNNLQYNCFRRYAFIYRILWMAAIYEGFFYENMWTKTNTGTIIRNFFIVRDGEDFRLSVWVFYVLKCIELFMVLFDEP